MALKTAGTTSVTIEAFDANGLRIGGPAEVYGDPMRRAALMALLATGLPVSIADQPLVCGAMGAGLALEQVEVLKNAMVN
mgnify:CR=1 FL=1